MGLMVGIPHSTPYNSPGYWGTNWFSLWTNRFPDELGKLSEICRRCIGLWRNPNSWSTFCNILIGGSPNINHRGIDWSLAVVRKSKYSVLCKTSCSSFVCLLHPRYRQLVDRLNQQTVPLYVGPSTYIQKSFRTCATGEGCEMWASWLPDSSTN